MGYIKRVLIYQVLAIVLLTGIGLLFRIMVALMMLIGASTSMFGTTLFAWGVFKQHAVKDPAFLLGRFYIAEMLKIFVVVTAFTLTFVLIEEADPVILSGAYFFTQVFPLALASIQDDGSK